MISIPLLDKAPDVITDQLIAAANHIDSTWLANDAVTISIHITVKRVKGIPKCTAKLNFVAHKVTDTKNVPLDGYAYSQ